MNTQDKETLYVALIYNPIDSGWEYVSQFDLRDNDIYSEIYILFETALSLNSLDNCTYYPDGIDGIFFHKLPVIQEGEIVPVLIYKQLNNGNTIILSKTRVDLTFDVFENKTVQIDGWIIDLLKKAHYMRQDIINQSQTIKGDEQ